MAQRLDVQKTSIGGKRFAPMFAKEPGNPAHVLQSHLDDLEIDPVE